MKVLFLYKSKGPDGANRVVVTQGKSLERRGVEIEYLGLEGRGPGVYLKSPGIIRKRLKTSGAVLIHAHYGITAIAGLLAAGGRPVIVSFMGSDLLGSRSPDGSIKPWSRVMRRLNVFLARYFYSFSVVKSVQMERMLLRNTRHAVIPNGVDMNMFMPVERQVARRSLGLDAHETIVLFAADRNNPEKNFPLASAAVESPGTGGVRLQVVNNASREEMNMWLNAADMLLVTSFHEGSPNIVKEAMACCCPVVSTDVGDISWLFGDLDGHWLSGFDTAELAAKIMEAAEYRKEKQFTDGRARITLLGLDEEKTADLLTDHYARITGNKRK
jgi:glycosyltransferase involved in cell wall biosynthesis